MKRLMQILVSIGLIVFTRPANPAVVAQTNDNHSPTVEGCPVFPPDNPWNRDISQDPVDQNSARYIAYINGGGDTYLRADLFTILIRPWIIPLMSIHSSRV